MTVCIAAFAAKSDAIVLISDKAITRGSMVSDTTITKMSQLRDSSWFALIAGDISAADEIILQIENRLSEYDGSQLCMMKIAGTAYQTVYNNYLSAAVFAPKLLKREEILLRERKFLPLPDRLNEEISTDRKQFERDWYCELLICGFDGKSNPHIIRVTKGGNALSENRVGYSAIGVGADPAIGRLMFFETDRDDHLSKVLWETFDAKVQAEIMQGVEYKWDASVVLKSEPAKHHRVPDHIQSLMDKVIEYRNTSPFEPEPWKEDDIPRADWQETIVEYADALIPRALEFC